MMTVVWMIVVTVGPVRFGGRRGRVCDENGSGHGDDVDVSDVGFDIARHGVRGDDEACDNMR